MTAVVIVPLQISFENSILLAFQVFLQLQIHYSYILTCSSCIFTIVENSLQVALAV